MSVQQKEMCLVIDEFGNPRAVVEAARDTPPQQILDWFAAKTKTDNNDVRFGGWLSVLPLPERRKSEPAGVDPLRVLRAAAASLRFSGLMSDDRASVILEGRLEYVKLVRACEAMADFERRVKSGDGDVAMAVGEAALALARDVLARLRDKQ